MGCLKQALIISKQLPKIRLIHVTPVGDIVELYHFDIFDVERTPRRS